MNVSDEVVEKLALYALYVMCSCTALTALSIILLCRMQDYDKVIQIALAILVAGPAIGFLLENIVGFIKDKGWFS